MNDERWQYLLSKKSRKIARKTPKSLPSTRRKRNAKEYHESNKKD